jgi:hypothetical protein
MQCPGCGTTIRSRLPDAEDAARIAELEMDVSAALPRIAELETRLADYERTRTLGGPVTDRRVPTLPGAWTNT